MVQTLTYLLAVGICQIQCGWLLPDLANEATHDAIVTTRVADDTPQQVDGSKPTVHKIEIGDVAPVLQSAAGHWVNRKEPVLISNKPKELTLIVFGTVW